MAKKKVERPVIYDKVVTKLRTGTRALTVEDSMGLLGWCEDEAEAKSRGLSEHHYEMQDGTKVWFTNNFLNRPIYSQNVSQLKQKHLNKEMCFNAEPVKIGRTGIVVDGQHFMISHVEAEKERLLDPAKWDRLWQGPITAEKLIVYGIEESDRVLDSMDCVRPRSSTDVIFRSDFYADKPRLVRKELSQMTDVAVRVLWERTGAKLDAWSPYRTHGETVDFIRRHMRVCDAVRHLHECNKDQGVSEYVSAGYAAGLLYLMGACGADQVAYYGQPPLPVHLRKEESIDFNGSWDKACEFWSLLPFDKSFSPLRNAIQGLYEGGTMSEKKAIILNAWSRHLAGKKLGDVSLGEADYTTPTGGKRKLSSPPVLSGIDLGDGYEPPPASPTTTTDPEPAGDYTPTETDLHKGEDVDNNQEPRPLMLDILDRLHRENTEVGIFFTKPSGGKLWYVWDMEAELVGKVTDKEPKNHPTRLVYLSFKQDDLEGVIDLMTDATYTVATVEEGVKGWTVTSVFKPKKVRSKK